MPRGRKLGPVSERDLVIFKAVTVDLRTLADVADEYWLTRERIRQIVNRTAKRLGTTYSGKGNRDARKHEAENITVQGIPLVDFMRTFLVQHTLTELAAMRRGFTVHALGEIASRNNIDFVKGPEHSHCPDCGKVRGGTTGKRCHECSLKHREEWRKNYYARQDIKDRLHNYVRLPHVKARQKVHNRKWTEKHSRLYLEKGA
jgi:hypothetical protein